VARHWALWGKAARKVEIWHPLLCHLIDVAEVAGRLLDVGVPSRLRRRLVATTGLDENAARGWLLFLVALHDLGKASPPFQAKSESRRKALGELGFDFPLEPGDAPHGVVSIRLLETLLWERYGFSRSASRELARAVGMHHGQAPSPLEVAGLPPRQLGRTPPWSAARDELIGELEALYGIDGKRPDPAIARDGGFLLLLAGLTSVADWLGSMEEFFRYAPEPRDAARYRREAATRAAEAVATAGFRPLGPASAATFLDLFGKPPRPLHETVEALLPHVEPGALVIVEAPTGEGKTEAALQFAEHFARLGQEGIFLALPTQATSNQTFRRVRAHLERSRSAQRTNLQLVHGAAATSNELRRLRTAAVFDEGGEVVAESWFTGGKRALLAATAVGTVDQALLGVLRLRHCFVRLFGLAGKTVILDEIHAYDTYTSRLIDRFLGWLHDVGASVVLLSATLPARRRAELMATFGGKPAGDDRAFPRITVVGGDETRVVPTASHAPSRRISIDRIEDDVEHAAWRLVRDLEEGGCAAWICNTVARAQEAYRTLKRLRSEGAFPADTELGLIHSRLPLAVRSWRERQARLRFGPEGRRPKRAILVGTQVLEQSLDLDFDRMVSDFAPIDLLLQRAGRLHRHHREVRPAPMREPRLLLVQPTGGDRPEGPSFNSVAGIYETAILLRSWWVLRQRETIVLPDQLEPLIEQVYGGGPLEDTPDELLQRLSRAIENFEQKQERAEDAAEARLLPEAGAPGVLGACSSRLEEDAPELHPSLQALTRLGGPSVQVVCLYETSAGTALDPAGRRPVDLSRSLDPTQTRALLCRSLNISGRRLAVALLPLSEPQALRASSALRRHRALLFRPDGSSAQIPGLQLDRELGVVFEKEKEVDS
jgi:CRISPR-associated endonuclease/helicase Cas3